MTPRFEATVQWKAGWLASAQRLDSPNFSQRPKDAKIDLIVVHSISLPPGSYGGEQVQQLFTNQLDWQAHAYYQEIRGMQVSSHFYIGRSGKLWQFVSCDDRAWHAGVSRFGERDNCNDFSIGIELEGLEGDLFEAAQYQQLGKLCRALRMAYPINHVAGHDHVAPGRKFDPGAGFDWMELQKMTGWRHQCFPALSFLQP